MDWTHHISKGNQKLGTDTLIFNMGSATDCPSKRLGLCQLGKQCHKCYAYKAERQYPSVLPYRRRQAHLWATSSPQDIAAALRSKAERSQTRIRYVRFNEAGDFSSQDDVAKLVAVARLLPEFQLYGYTARRDLSFARLPGNLSICGSGWRRGRQNEFRAVQEYTGKNARCAGDCRKCNLCKTAKGRVIENRIHWN